MKKIIIGGLAVLLGVAGVSHFFFTFLGIVAGALPAILILGGLLAAYLGYTDLQAEDDIKAPEDLSDTDQEVSGPVSPELDTPGGESASQPTQDPEPAADKDAPAPEATEEETSPAATPAGPSAPLFKGNADTLVFHSIECKFTQGKNCTVEFDTREAAVAQGYKPCKVCTP